MATIIVRYSTCPLLLSIVRGLQKTLITSVGFSSLVEGLNLLGVQMFSQQKWSKEHA